MNDRIWGKDHLESLRRGWIVVACLSSVGIVAGVIFGVSWPTVINGFLLGGAMASLQVSGLLKNIRAMREAHTDEVAALMHMNNAEIGAAIAAEMHRRMSGEEPPQRPTMQ